MGLCVIHDCTHVSAIQMVVTIPWDFIFFMMILLYRMAVSMPWILDYRWSFYIGWLQPCHGSFHVVLIIWIDASIPWIHVLISNMYMYMRPWFVGLLIVFFLILAKASKASQPSLLVLPSRFRGHPLHSILSHLLHFPMKYPEVPKTWPLWSVLIQICSLDPS